MASREVYSVYADTRFAAAKGIFSLTVSLLEIVVP